MTFKSFSSLAFTLFALATATTAQSAFEEIAKSYIAGQSGPFESIDLDADDLALSSSHRSKQSGTTHIYIQQKHKKLDVYKAVGSVHVNDDGEVVYANNRFIDVAGRSIRDVQNLDAVRAVEKAAAHFNLSLDRPTEVITSLGGAERAHELQNASMAFGTIKAKLVYLSLPAELALVWDVAFEKKDDHFWWNVRLDAATGEVLDKNTWTVECNFDHLLPSRKPSLQNKEMRKTSEAHSFFVPNSYNVYEFPVEAPNDGNRSIVVSPWDQAPNASPFGWHDNNGIAGAEFTDTRGNNVYAQEDVDDNDSDVGAFRPDGGPTLEFDFNIDLTMSPSTYQAAAITNLFYANNFMHDVMYQYGFDEAAGNFQNNNYGKGGLSKDQVNADAQDGSGTNNANFGTPADGSPPRMQMFEWVPTFGSAELEVTSPVNIAQTFDAAKASFGNQSPLELSGTLVLADPVDACAVLNNAVDILGNIALIDRGNCSFDDKINAAELAGATSAIVCNNVPGDGFLSMGGDGNPPVTIPSGMISFEDCEIIKAEMPGVEVTYRQFDIPNTDSDLDNGIIAHEYGHGISNRLTGGPANVSCLSGEERMGEGWSDFMAVITTIKAEDLPKDGRGVGTYVQGDDIGGAGIRPFRYSTDLDINPHTYDSIKDPSLSVPHGVGTVWNAMLWEMTWNLIQKYGFDPDIYFGTGGNNIALQLVMEGMKLQPCDPGFVDGRDAILQADVNLYAGANSCEIWRAFAKRGLGINAIQGTSASRTDGTEDFTVPMGCELDPCSMEAITYNNETIPDMTDEKVEDAITTTGTVDIAGSSSSVTLSAGWGMDIQGEFTTPQSSELTVNTDPCDPAALPRPIKAKTTGKSSSNKTEK